MPTISDGIRKPKTPPSERSIKDTLKLVDFNKVDFDTKEIRFAQKAWACSLTALPKAILPTK